jgi:TolA-binding protein
MNFSPFLVHRLLLIVIALCAGSASLVAQAPTPESEFASAQELFIRGDYPAAAAAFEKVVADYPTSTVAGEAQFRHGLSRYVAGEFDRAITELRKSLSPSTAPALQELASSLIPQALAAKAAKLDAADPNRKAAYEEAIKAYDAFIQKYPQSAELETAIYGRALSAFQIERYEETEKGLRINLERFPRSESILDSQYVLALVLATQASQAAQSAKALTPEAVAQYDEAEKFLGDIIAKGTDIALMNDARFQLGELLLSRAAFAPRDVQASLWERATAAYRSVEPKEPLIRAQQARIAAFPNRIRAAALAKDAPLVQRLQGLRQREESKLAQLRTRADQTITAKIRVGQILFQQNRFDESRTLLRYCEKFAEDADQKKSILYFTTLTYASQNIVDKALAGYEQWKSQFRTDPMGENLPLVIGTMYLSPDPKLNAPDKAIAYFKEALELFPNGRFVDQALAQQAAALLQLQRYDEALDTYKQFLSKNPARELAAVAELGIATVYQQTNRIDEAIAAFKAVRDKYKDLPPGEQAAYSVGQLTLSKGDARGAIAELNAFIQSRPESPLVPQAMYLIAQAQQTAGDKPAALETFRQLGEKYPNTEAGIFSFIQRGTLLITDNRFDEMIAVMRDFIARYPESDKLFFGYDMIAQAQTNGGKLEDAVATYLQMADAHPKNPQAPDALLRAAQVARRRADSLGRYLAIGEEQRAQWTAALDVSIKAAERLLREYPEREQVALALQELLAAQRLLVSAQLKQPADVEKYFSDLAEQFGKNPGTRSKILFTLAAYISERDKAKALAQMEAAYDPKLVYAAADLDLYGEALIERKQWDKASEIYQKLAADYPNPPNTPPEKAPVPIMEAQATALFGQAIILQQQGKTADASALFDQLKRRYPWSPKIVEANYGIALGLSEAKKYSEATALLVQIVRAQNANSELRANAMLLLGKIQEIQNQIDPAIDQFIKISVFYKAVPAAAAEGLWRGGQLLEKQSAGITDAAKKKAQFEKAVKAYRDLVQAYPDSPFAEQAQKRLQEIQPGK